MSELYNKTITGKTDTTLVDSPDTLLDTEPREMLSPPFSRLRKVFQNIARKGSTTSLDSVGSASSSKSSVASVGSHTSSISKRKRIMKFLGHSILEHPEKLDLDTCIQKLSASDGKGDFVLSAEEVAQLCNDTRELVASQPIFLELKAPVVIAGDIHGQFTDLLRLFQESGDPSVQNYLFLGDYVDRGKQSMESICLLMCYKLKYRETFFLLRGNHECPNVNRSTIS
jgi:hypothetical protein